MLGRTPLHLAASGGHEDVVRSLVIFHKIHKVDNAGWSAFHHAADNGHLEVIKFLIKSFNCDLDLKNQDGQTALELAESKEHNHILLFFNPSQDVNQNQNPPNPQNPPHPQNLQNPPNPQNPPQPQNPPNPQNPLDPQNPPNPQDLWNLQNQPFEPEDEFFQNHFEDGFDAL